MVRPPQLRRHLGFVNPTEDWNADPSRVEDAHSGEEVLRLSGRYTKPNVAQWDGRHLVAGYESGEVLILDQTTMKLAICTAHTTN